MPDAAWLTETGKKGPRIRGGIPYIRHQPGQGRMETPYARGYSLLMQSLYQILIVVPVCTGGIPIESFQFTDRHL